ncbi:MAG: arsenate reductase family protein [Streptococcaceae bacterium]|jgi:arsenate reductase|nr:arsenate reductase family protein [Streptococcaceae bacterium]
MIDFYGHPKCTTCKKALAWLAEHDVDVKVRDIRQDVPSEEMFHAWFHQGKFASKQLFNTSGQKYRSLGLKAQLPKMSKDAQAELLASDGMLIKRPLLIRDGVLIAVGFKETAYQELFD